MVAVALVAVAMVEVAVVEVAMVAAMLTAAMVAAGIHCYLCGTWYSTDAEDKAGCTTRRLDPSMRPEH